MSDNDQNFDTRTDAAAEDALDALLAGHQAGLHAVLGAALDTRAGLAQLGHRRPAAGQRSCTYSNFAMTDVTVVAQLEGADTGGLIVVASQQSSSLEGALHAIEDELLNIGAFLQHPDRHFLDVRLPDTEASSRDALLLVSRELKRIAELLGRGQITKDSARAEFADVQAVLQDQLRAWGNKIVDEHTEREGQIFEEFLRRFNAVKALRRLIIWLFEDTDTTLLQLN
ncbi:hypothetical protein ACFV6G_29420 [Streptomyces lavendulae]|uniref:hypothetical protein n=1 Tax=Streptomyces lavendulae TaxID=1914 RepID=UPI0036903718